MPVATPSMCSWTSLKTSLGLECGQEKRVDQKMTMTLLALSL